MYYHNFIIIVIDNVYPHINGNLAATPFPSEGCPQGGVVRGTGGNHPVGFAATPPRASYGMSSPKTKKTNKNIKKELLA
jgi:hypothetical protein